MKSNSVFKVIIVCLILTVILLFIIRISKHKGLLQIANPLTEVKTLQEMKKYLGFDVPVIKEKRVKKYIVIGQNKKAIHARIIYADDSSFEMEKGKHKDVSGIYGGILKKKISVSGGKVSIYKYGQIIYAVWNDSKYSYSYSLQKGTEKELINDIKLIK